ncbi:MAG TPA: hypothetical protein EYH46_02855 [Sulfurivirga caldicuralii]|nr:hypothetical protein [Sulfurivirga caldicuralii]
MNNILYLPSTPLNLLLSAAHALAHPAAARLLYLDQKRPSPYLSALRQWAESPFAQVAEQVVPAGVLARWRVRQATFRQLDAWWQACPWARVAVGSDRRVEFQYAVSRKRGIQGDYLDDGLYSYMGRPWRPIKDRLDGVLKRLVYGRWWQTPPTIGASQWIADAWLFAPEQAVAPLRQKQVHKIEPEWFQRPEMLALGAQVLAQFQVDVDSLSRCDRLLLLTHPNNAGKIPGYERRVAELLQRWHRLHVAAKYHPRTEGDPFNVQAQGVSTLLPATLAFEFVLPFLPPGMTVVADVSTTLLTARWLRPDLRLIALLDGASPLERRVLPVMQAMGIETMTSKEMAQCTF